ncbi:MAG: hypothetical protein GX315_04230 [Spirochaetales bacterium]|nr:hypothetical protein [Spirochaetales bacterium]
MGNDWYTTDLKQRPVQRSRRFVRIEQMVVLMMLLCVMAAMFVPLWQRGVNRSLEIEYQTLLNNRQALEEQRQVLLAGISKLSMPEQLVEGAWKEDIAFQPIRAEAVIMLSRRVHE